MQFFKQFFRELFKIFAPQLAVLNVDLKPVKGFSKF